MTRIERWSRLGAVLTSSAGLALAVAHAGSWFRQAGATEPAALSAARQLVLVVTGDWDDVGGTLRRFERPRSGLPWTEVGQALPIVVGRHGLAWGLGLHGDPPAHGLVKREGDGRSPAGIFRLSASFGYDAPPPGLRLPYLRATESIECVDDPDSRNYNRLLDRRSVAAPDWKTSEQMKRPDEAYRWGVVVDHNAPPATPRGGSCIFLHVWGGPASGTAGCTAMEGPRILELMLWLTPEAAPVLVQLPAPEYSRLRGPWNLPH